MKLKAAIFIVISLISFGFVSSSPADTKAEEKSETKAKSETSVAEKPSATDPIEKVSNDSSNDLPKIAKADAIDPKVLELGLNAYSCASKKGVAPKDNVLTIIDYSKPSSEKRLYVVDMNEKKVTSEQLVAHGSGSGGNKATKFSNNSGTHQSSYGVFVTGETYVGKNGLSLRLDGLEKGVNDHARSRAVVIHGANYVNENFVKSHGRLGRSWGCPALDKAVSKKTIDELKGGSLLFAYYPNNDWINNSQYLHC